MEQTIGVLFYNILSTDLALNSIHNGCDPKYLRNDVRIPVVLKQLKKYIDLKFVICLQELSDDWLEHLIPFFRNFNYTLIYDSVFLGNAIAFPNLYTFKAVKFFEIGWELKKMSIENSHTKVLMSKLWSEAADSNKRIVVVTLELDGFIFNIFNYHVPAKGDSNRKIIHLMIIEQIINKQLPLPYLLVGDFNFQIGSPLYRFLMGQRTLAPKIPIGVNFINLPEERRIKLMSIWNWKSKKKIIDHIFYTPGFEIVELQKKVITNHCPGPDEGSDHTISAAIFKYLIVPPVPPLFDKPLSFDQFSFDDELSPAEIDDLLAD
jgi:endonuclease/exonuclease/phosphatase family metal-dependent hydrolase